MNYTNLYLNWCCAQGTTPTPEEFEQFQNTTIYAWLESHGWKETSRNARRSYWHHAERGMWASVPANVSIDVRFYRAGGVEFEVPVEVRA